MYTNLKSLRAGKGGFNVRKEKFHQCKIEPLSLGCKFPTVVMELMGHGEKPGVMAPIKPLLGEQNPIFPFGERTESHGLELFPPLLGLLLDWAIHLCAPVMVLLTGAVAITELS